MMKKNTILFIIAIFVLLLIANYSSAATCVDLKGTCKTACATGETINLDGSGSCRTETPNCCVPQSTTDTNNTTGTTATINFINPLKFETVEDVLYSLLSYLQGIIVVVSLIFIVVGAVLYITSSGDEQRTTMARKAITASLIGLAIGIAAPTFLKEIATIIGWIPKGDQGMLSKATPLATIALNTLNFLLGLVGTIAIIMLVVGGMMYLTAAGSEDQIDKGKKLVKFAIMGIIVALASLVIVRQIATFFT